MALPTRDTVHATPGSPLQNFNFLGRGMLLKIRTVIREPSQLVRFDVIESVREGHVTMDMVMSVSLSVCSDMEKLRGIATRVEAPNQSPREIGAIIKELVKGDSARNRSVIEEQPYAVSGREVLNVSASRIDALPKKIHPWGGGICAQLASLLRRENSELDPKRA